MKNILLIAMLIVCTSIASKGQNKTEETNPFSIVNLPKFYKEKGIIFNEDYAVGIDIKNLKNRFSPTVTDIERAEEIFSNRYNHLQGTSIDVKSSFCNWVRQYIGVVDSNGKRNIIVQLVNNKKPGKINRLLGKGWENNFVVMLSDDFYKVSSRFRIIIDTGEMSSGL